ncbi:MAG TPA: glycosyltransferase [Acidobacteriota bacterium]|nr:glycosyltransferase [Acidobacteriota bacterium]
MNLLVTVGVCVRNSTSTLPDAIKSIIEQDFSHKQMEVIFVDDGSTDGTLSMLKKYASRMDIATSIYSFRWQGLGPSRNVVMNNAKGKYIVWVDGDMMLPSDHIRKQVMFMERNPNVGIAKARYGTLLGEKSVATLENISDIVEDALAGNYWEEEAKLPGSGGSIYRVEAVKRIGGFDDKIKGVGEDQDVAYRVRAAGWVLSRSEAVFFERRENTWKALWSKYFWYGYGNYALYSKNRGVFSLYRMVPPASFIIGLFYAVIALRIAHSLVFILLPFHFGFKSTAWLFGFVRGQFMWTH